MFRVLYKDDIGVYGAYSREWKRTWKLQYYLGPRVYYTAHWVCGFSKSGVLLGGSL